MSMKMRYTGCGYKIYLMIMGNGKIAVCNKKYQKFNFTSGIGKISQMVATYFGYLILLFVAGSTAYVNVTKASSVMDITNFTRSPIYRKTGACMLNFSDMFVNTSMTFTNMSVNAKGFGGEMGRHLTFFTNLGKLTLGTRGNNMTSDCVINFVNNRFSILGENKNEKHKSAIAESRNSDFLMITCLNFLVYPQIRFQDGIYGLQCGVDSLAIYDLTSGTSSSDEEINSLLKIKNSTINLGVDALIRVNQFSVLEGNVKIGITLNPKRNDGYIVGAGMGSLFSIDERGSLEFNINVNRDFYSYVSASLNNNNEINETDEDNEMRISLVKNFKTMINTDNIICRISDEFIPFYEVTLEKNDKFIDLLIGRRGNVPLPLLALQNIGGGANNIANEDLDEDNINEDNMIGIANGLLLIMEGFDSL